VTFLAHQRQAVQCIEPDDRGKQKKEVPLDEVERRDLDVSEGTVRQRIKRLQDARLMKVMSWVDPRAIDRAGHVFYIRFVLGSVSSSAMAQRSPPAGEAASRSDLRPPTPTSRNRYS
jgi:hypothetical protein